jgi:hypothetical protein
MAKVDISGVIGATNIGEPDVAQEANNEPAPLQPRLLFDSIRMRATGLVVVTKHLGCRRPAWCGVISLLLLIFCTSIAHADPAAAGPTSIDPDPPARTPAIAPPHLPLSADLDGLYVWLGPSGAASRIGAEWDSTVGGDLSVIRVREHEPVGAIGASFGAQRWTVRGGGRLWLDGVIGTNLGRMIGLSAGPILELNELAHPRFGGSVGAWGFVGVAPYVRVGAVQDLGGFVELGLHIALPVLRHRH